MLSSRLTCTRRSALLLPFRVFSARLIILQYVLYRQEEKHMKRTNLYLTEKQMERLHQRAEKEGLAIAELVRRAVDAFLAWDDLKYAPSPYRPKRKGHSSPP